MTANSARSWRGKATDYITNYRPTHTQNYSRQATVQLVNRGFFSDVQVNKTVGIAYSVIISGYWFITSIVNH